MASARRLTDIANDTGTDKGTVHNSAHAYTLVYEALFESLRDRPINLLEIGLAIGGPEHGASADRDVTDVPSIRMWREYFPLATIYGADISDFSKFETSWFKFSRVDCGDVSGLDAIAERFRTDGVRFDIIIDDASHASYHQQLTLLKFFDLLKPGGFYVIEDLGWVPEAYETSLPSVPRTREVLAGILEKGRASQTGALQSSEWDAVMAHVGSILSFDGAYLADLRRFYTARSGGGRKAGGASFLGNLYKRVRSVVRLLTGETASSHVRQMQLAILQRTPSRVGG